MRYMVNEHDVFNAEYQRLALTESHYQHAVGRPSRPH